MYLVIVTSALFANRTSFYRYANNDLIASIDIIVIMRSIVMLAIRRREGGRRSGEGASWWKRRRGGRCVEVRIKGETKGGGGRVP